MPAKSTRKRKVNPDSEDPVADSDVLNRDTWPGWVEMESEPAFFNAMLHDMGVGGARVHEVYSLDSDMLAVLPHPVHALIFLFKYKDFSAEDQEESNCPDHVWFANQVPDFACASIALLNIINNISDLTTGQELKDFANFTKDMTPLDRGIAIDSFDFVRKIHNSFARETDILNADMHLRNKAAKARKKAAAKKAAESRKAKVMNSSKYQKVTKAGETMPIERKTRTVRASTHSSNGLHNASELQIPATAKFAKAQPPKRQDSGTNKFATGFANHSEVSDVQASSLDTTDHRIGLRRSGRPQQPRKNMESFVIEKDDEADPEEEGFHFIAYMPIGDHVWKLDGMDAWPTDLGSFCTAEGGSWLDVARPALQARILQYTVDEIHFNLMAVCHDPLMGDKEQLVKNVQSIKTLDQKLDSLDTTWRELDGGETNSDLITGACAEYNISQLDLDQKQVEKSYCSEDNLLELIKYRKGMIVQQSRLREAVRDALKQLRLDLNRAQHRRHSYNGFIKGWLEAIAENEMLASIL